MNIWSGGRVAPGDCSPEALTRTGQGDFHHPLMCLVATYQQPATGRPTINRSHGDACHAQRAQPLGPDFWLPFTPK